MVKPNHICKYSGCTLGDDGGRKHYYACDYCDRTETWRSMACCIEHYELYIKEVLEARAANKAVNTLPERTDKTESEVKEILTQDENQALESAKEELKDYMSCGETIAEAVEKANSDIEKKNSKRRRRKTK